jgi:hypothetical protein
MKTKLFVLIVAILITALATPDMAYAWQNINCDTGDGSECEVIDAYGDAWTHGFTVEIIGATSLNTLCGPFNFDGTVSTFSVPCPGPYPSESGLWVVVDPNPGPQGDPGPFPDYNGDPQGGIWQSIQALHWPGIGDGELTNEYDTESGPNAIVLKDFSARTSAASPSWLPYVLVVGSLALVSGALTIVRKRRP